MSATDSLEMDVSGPEVAGEDIDLTAVPEHFKKGRRWVEKYLQTLDPETDYARIMAVAAAYRQSEFTMQLNAVCVQIWIMLNPTGAEAQCFTGKFIRRPNARAQESVNFFWKWFEKGPNHPDTIASIKQLNALHMKVAKIVPGNFGINEEFVHTMIMLSNFFHHLFEKLDMPGYPDYMKIAAHHFWRDVAQYMETESGLMEDFPEDWDDMERRRIAFEAEPKRFHPIMNDLCEGVILAFQTRFFPKGLRFLGRWMVLFAVRRESLEHNLIEPLGPIKTFVARSLFKGLFTLESWFGKDPTTSFMERRVQLSKEELRRRDAIATELADEQDLTGAGEVYLRKNRFEPQDPELVAQCPFKVNGKLVES